MEEQKSEDENNAQNESSQNELNQTPSSDSESQPSTDSQGSEGSSTTSEPSTHSEESKSDTTPLEASTAGANDPAPQSPHNPLPPQAARSATTPASQTGKKGGSTSTYKVPKWKLFTSLFLFVFVLLQFGQLFFCAFENPKVEADFDGPSYIADILRRSCYDCHSNETDWPGHAHIPPAGFIVNHHVEEGREYLNFSDWGKLSREKQIHEFEEVIEEIEEGHMPLPAYLWLHPKAKLSEEDIVKLKKYFESLKSNSPIIEAPRL